MDPTNMEGVEGDKTKRIPTWYGVPVETLPHSRLVEIIAELIEDRDWNREQDYKRMKSLFSPEAIEQLKKDGL